MLIATTTLLVLLNAARPPNFKLQSDKFLVNLAEQRCTEIKKFNHDGFFNKTQYQMIKNYYYLGENLAIDFQDATSTFIALENSPGHKENNHATRYTNVGISNCDNKIGNTTIILFGGKK